MTFNQIVIKNILRDKWTYISYFLSSVFSILVFFLFLITAFHPMLDVINPNSTLGITMIGSGMIVYVFSFVFIVYSMLAFLKKKTKSLGVFMISGASMKQVKKMVFRENMLIGIAAIFTSVSLGLILSPLFLMMVKNILDADNFGMYFPIQAVSITIIFFLILFIIVSKFTTRFIKKEEAIQLLKTDLTPENDIKPAPIRLLVSIGITFIALFSLRYGQSIEIIYSIVETLGGIFYIVTFASLLLTIYLLITQGMLYITNRKQKSRSYFKNTNMIFTSNLRAKGNSYSHIIFLLTLLLLAVFIGTSVLYSTYYNVEESAESSYPYSLQYVSLPQNSNHQMQEDLNLIENTFNKENESYISYQSAFKSDWDRRIGFMSTKNYNSLGEHEEIELSANEYYAVAGYENIEPNTEWMNDYTSSDLELKGVQERNILSTSLQNVYYVLPDELYNSFDYPEIDIFAYELSDWTTKQDVISEIEEEVDTIPNERLITSKVSLYGTEDFVNRITFFIGFMLSLIFLSASMSILYFYLQTSLAEERKKYLDIRKIGLSIKEIKTVVTKELQMLIFVPFTFATILLFLALFSLRNVIAGVFFRVSAIGVGLFAFLFVLSFFIIRKVYMDKLIS